MNQSSTTTPASWIDDRAELTGACEAIGRDGLAIDTEFVRTRTFYAQLGLIQMADRDQCLLVDPLAIEDLEPVWQLLADGALEKVIHSGSEDLEIFVRLAGSSPRPLFDTQVAAGLCGLGPSLSYQALVAEVCDRHVEKGESRSDWLQRPLTDAQLRYAELDVHYLLPIRDALHERLETLGRRQWLDEDMERLCRSAEVDSAIEDQFARFKLAWKLDPQGAEILYRLIEWREATARQRDLPRNRVLDNDVLLDIAFQKPTDRDELKRKTRIHPKAAGRHGDALLEHVEQARSVPDDALRSPPGPPLDLSHKREMKALKAVVRERAGELGIAPETLASKRELVALLQEDELPEKLLGWRREAVGDALLETLKDFA